MGRREGKETDWKMRRREGKQRRRKKVERFIETPREEYLVKVGGRKEEVGTERGRIGREKI